MGRVSVRAAIREGGRNLLRSPLTHLSAAWLPCAVGAASGPLGSLGLLLVPLWWLLLINGMAATLPVPARAAELVRFDPLRQRQVLFLALAAIGWLVGWVFVVPFLVTPWLIFTPLLVLEGMWVGEALGESLRISRIWPLVRLYVVYGFAVWWTWLGVVVASGGSAEHAIKYMSRGIPGTPIEERAMLLTYLLLAPWLLATYVALYRQLLAEAGPPPVKQLAG